MKVRIDLQKCYRAGECYYNHPELFRMGEEGDPVVLVDELSDEATLQHAQEAAEVCPAAAIEVVDS